MKTKTEAEQFHPLSLEYQNKRSIAYRKKNGQYFTPKNICEDLLRLLPKLDRPKILDPGCGSGEFLAMAHKFYPDSELFGWDIEPELLTICKTVCPQGKYSHKNALVDISHNQFDLIIGNPPYYEFKPDKKLKENYCDVISGRPNIFAMFIKKGLQLLKEGGHLGFVVPPSMNNGAFFKSLRKYIIENASIEHLKILPDQSLFNKAQQAVMLIVLRKSSSSKNYIFEKNGLMIFSPNSARLKELFTGQTTLYEQSFQVRTGSVIWNENRDKLTNTSTGNLPLIWSRNIKNGLIDLRPDEKKPQYIAVNKYLTGPAIVVNRITGIGTKSSLRSAVIAKGNKFIAENHVNVIISPPEYDYCKLSLIAEYLASNKTTESIKLITGNTQLSKTELERLLPFPRKFFISNS